MSHETSQLLFFNQPCSFRLEKKELIGEGAHGKVFRGIVVGAFGKIDSVAVKMLAGNNAQPYREDVHR